MSQKSSQCSVELDIKSISSPGTWLPYRNDVYVSVTMFGQTKNTTLTIPIFPLVFNQKINFQKVFYSSYEPTQVVRNLANEQVRIELLQLCSYIKNGRLLAWFQCNVKKFLYPTPGMFMPMGIDGRQVFMDRSLSFPGLCPRLEFSTKTNIKELFLLDQPIYKSTYDYNQDGSNFRSDNRKKSKSRSVSPKSDRKSNPVTANDNRDFDDDDDIATIIIKSGGDALDNRPPFVVRKVEDSLIGRQPEPMYPLSRPTSPQLDQRSRSKTRTGLLDHDYNKSYGYSKWGARRTKSSSPWRIRTNNPMTNSSKDYKHENEVRTYGSDSSLDSDNNYVNESYSEEEQQKDENLLKKNENGVVVDQKISTGNNNNNKSKDKKSTTKFDTSLLADTNNNNNNNNISKNNSYKFNYLNSLNKSYFDAYRRYGYSDLYNFPLPRIYSGLDSLYPYGYYDYSSRSPYYHYYNNTVRFQLLRDRIKRALRRNRSMEHLQRLQSISSPYEYWPYYDYLDDLDLGDSRRKFLN